MNRLFFLPLFLGILSFELRGELTLHPLIGDHAVFQRDVAFPVIGKADPDSEVVVKWQGKDFKANAGADGMWLVRLDPSPANEKGQILKVTSGTNSIEVTDILIGEVWLASGQSNMEWKLKQIGAQSLEAEKAEGNDGESTSTNESAKESSIPAKDADSSPTIEWDLTKNSDDDDQMKLF